MREPKYQAYLTDENRMVQITSLNLIKNTKGEHEYLSIGFYLDGEDKFEGIGFVLSEAKLRQYTGLKDKNGMEIYEGDIVEFTVFNHNDIDTQYKGVVKYRSGLYEIWKNNDSEFFESDGAFILNFVWLQDEEFRVIGNIHINPELLQ